MRRRSSSKCVIPKVIADDNAVNGIIQLLRHITDQHWYHKCKDLFPWRPLRHIYRFKEAAFPVHILLYIFLKCHRCCLNPDCSEAIIARSVFSV